MSRENVEVVRRLYDAFNDGDTPGLLELCDADGEWWARGDDPSAPVHRGHDGLRDWLAELGDAFTEFWVKPKQFLDAREHVVVVVHVHGRGRASGVLIEEHEVHAYRLRDGKITELREYHHKDEALKAVGLEE